MPQAAGLGGDMLALVHDGTGVHAVNGTGLSPGSLGYPPPTSGGGAVTVPGLVDGWLTLHARWGRLQLGTVLRPAIELAEHGVTVDGPLTAAVQAHEARLRAGGAADWSLLAAARDRAAWTQPELGRLLVKVMEDGRDALYAGSAADALVAAVRRCGGCLDHDDLAVHETPCPAPISVPWGAGQAYVQPPASQGVLLALALQKVNDLVQEGVAVTDHLLVEVTEAVFAHRSACGRGEALLGEHLVVDLERASGRGGPRSYLHTAGVATVDAGGQVVSSLVSVFDDFGSGVFVPALGIVLNNRAAGFTDGDNAPGPARRPVHTLAPALLTSPEEVLGIATPGADGQVQTLLQVLIGTALKGSTLGESVGALRWRSQDGDLLIEEGHPAIRDLVARGHRVRTLAPGADVFGAVVAAGTTRRSPIAVADWRRQTNTQGV